MTAPERMTVHGPEDILGFIPHSLGYWPASSLVAMTLRGTTLGATLRLDLPGLETQVDPSRFARAVRRYLQSDVEADGSLLAIFTTDAGAAPPTAYDQLVREVQAVLEQAGMPVRDAWFVGDEYWRDALCRDSSCCPLPGRPVQQIRDSMLNAEMVYRGSSVEAAPGTRTAPVPALPAPYVASVLAREDGWMEDLAGRTRSRAQFSSVLDFWERILGQPAGAPWRPDAERDAYLRATIVVPTWRDAVLVMAAAGRNAAEEGAELFGVLEDVADSEVGGDSVVSAPPAPPAACRDTSPRLRKPGFGAATAPAGVDRIRGPRLPNSAGPPVAGYGEILMGVAPEVPCWAAMDMLDRVLEHLAAPGGRAGAAALAGRGWVAWCRGRGSYAAAYLGEALRLEPGYRLAELLLDIVARGALCGWAARKDAAWQKFGPDPLGPGGGGVV
ncbi:DUF4192 family protein [Pseudarthrobacter sp. efr-133-R2A-89]|uniref:DUF4192 family protein n=1 Tax=Pseudarthrobacter sp. efr-133-R2A-89 TaxID=3040302 RepID=UPI0025551E92|nr:DUF4192 family protein [Pseudarthrobacter sp. efr-133-R2A-89]